MATEYLCCHLFVEDKLQIYKGALNADEILSSWRKDEQNSNYGAFVSFVGTVREEDGISALSFDLYEPILQKWFEQWQHIAQRRGAKIKMAHSVGDVPLHQCSFASAIFSPKRRVALEMLDEFVEDFKANAPIWKYDIKESKRLYAEHRSTPIDGAGILDLNF